MPGVLLIESLTQAATLLLLYDGEQVRNARTVLRRVTGTKFRRQVTPGDQVTLDIELRRRRGPMARLSAVASVAGQVVAEAELHVAVVDERRHDPPHRASSIPRRCSARARSSARTPRSALTSGSAATTASGRRA